MSKFLLRLIAVLAALAGALAAIYYWQEMYKDRYVVLFDQDDGSEEPDLQDFIEQEWA